MPIPIQIDDQPISASFFDVGGWLTSYVTPDALEVQELHKNIISETSSLETKLLAAWRWVADEVRYVPFVKAKLTINGKSSYQPDYWQAPSQVIGSKIGNCANKAFLLASLLRQDLSASQVKVALGNLHQPAPGGHAWVEVDYNSYPFIMEGTRGDMQPMVATRVADVYEPVIYFNDESVSAIEGRTLLTPFTAVYADWLKDYLDWAYIEGGK